MNDFATFDPITAGLILKKNIYIMTSVCDTAPTVLLFEKKFWAGDEQFQNKYF